MPLAALRKLLAIYLACLYSQHAIPFTRWRGHLPNERHNSCHSILVIWVKRRENVMPLYTFQECSAQFIARTFELYAQPKTMLWHTLTENSFTWSTWKPYVIVRPVLLILLRAINRQQPLLYREGAVDGMVVGDSGYACRSYLMTPVAVLNPRNEGEVCYNISHRRTV